MSERQFITIEAKARPKLENGNTPKANSLRTQGLIPGVLYGHNVATQELVVPAQTFSKVYKTAGESTILKLKVGESEPVNVLIHDIQRHGTRGEITHVDFYQVKMTEKLKATVPLRFVGESAAVKELQGTFVPTISEVEVESLPMDLPSEIEVDISVLKTFDDSIKVKDLNVDHSRVKIMIEDQEATIAAVQPPKSEEELEAELATPTEVNLEEVVEGIKKETPEGETAEGEQPESEKQPAEAKEAKE